MRVIDNVEFQRLIQCANKTIQIPSSITITRRLLDYRKAVEHAIQNQLPKAPQKIAIVLDCWSAPRRGGFIAIKAYWITRAWLMSEALIGFESVEGNHTGAALGNIVWKRLEAYHITTQVYALTSDNASNNKTLTDTLNDAIMWLNRRLDLTSTITQVPCLAHVLQIAVQQLLGKIKINPKNDEIQKNWIEESERQELEELGRNPAGPQQVRLW
jgi:hypothetical protein